MDSNTQALLDQRSGHVAHWLVWVNARERDTGNPVAVGFWSGDDHQVFTIRGQARTYFGAGALLNVDPIRQGVGLQVQRQTVTLVTTPEVDQAISGYDPSLQPAEIHRAIYDPATMTLTAEPEEAFTGTVDAAPIEEGPIGGTDSITLEIASKTRQLTRTHPIMKSDAALRRRAPLDGFRKYVSESAQWQVPWGEATVTGR